MRPQYMADAAAFADRFSLPAEQREAQIKLDMPSIAPDFAGAQSGLRLLRLLYPFGEPIERQTRAQHE